MSVLQTTRQVWVMPLVLGVCTVIGLLSALLADGVWDALSWGMLSIPVVTCLWPALRK